VEEIVAETSTRNYCTLMENSSTSFNPVHHPSLLKEGERGFFRSHQIFSPSLTLFYTHGSGIVVSHVMVPLPYGFPFDFLPRYGNLTILKFSFKWVKVMLPCTGGRAACSGGWGAV
jgi:hypothetical protein